MSLFVSGFRLEECQQMFSVATSNLGRKEGCHVC
jgi:hypothetical protein